MAEKFEDDAKRMKSRGFAGYAVDRIAGRNDFQKTNTPLNSGAENARDRQIRQAEEAALGMGNNEGSSVRNDDGSLKRPNQ